MKKLFLFIVATIVIKEVFSQELSDGSPYSIGARYTHEFVIDGFVRVREWELPGDKMKLKDLGMKSYPALQFKMQRIMKKKGCI
ncbi:MAG TPA: hypothetical protein VIT44_15985 [Cyclobacteriaceae bacterium]